MIPKEVYYERCINLGNYENEKIGIRIELDEGDTVKGAVDAARKRVDSFTATPQLQEERKTYQRIVDHPDTFLYRDVQAAKKWLEEHPSDIDEDLPF